ncbi:MAG: cation-transporting P-type ATPase [Gammaproteobacteria bacterium]|nr:cation-transporting P-type ATPase [Gammaproteobacteria bacterium]
MQYPRTQVAGKSPWSLSTQQQLALLDSRNTGLTQEEVLQRRRHYGDNVLAVSSSRPVLSILLAQFKSLMVLFLLAAVILSAVLGEVVDALAILFVILINAMIGFITELRAVRSMEALRKLGSMTTRVRREGKIQEIEAAQLVPGDIVILEGGDVISADMRLMSASKLEADESALTGESMPVSKDVTVLAPETLLAERHNMMFRGTALTRGSGEAVVVSTGMQTELGHIATMVEQTEEDELTPLERRLDQMGRRLIWLTLGLSILVTLSGVIAGKSLWLMIQTGIALAVATIPEGLPVVATIALARGMWRMARRSALINKLSAVETLGATSVICTDKTGTLTENRMTVQRYWTADAVVDVTGEGLSQQGEFYVGDRRILPREHPLLREALRIGALCSNAGLEGDKANGDPLEVALLVAAAKAGINQPELLANLPEAREEAFDTQTKMMATYHHEDGALYVAVKGAPEIVLNRCGAFISEHGERTTMDDVMRREWARRNEQMAADGLRVVALASKRADSTEDDAYSDLNLVALVGLQDPPREDIAPAIAECQAAGMRVVMITGDQEQTARSVAHAVGLIQRLDADVIHGAELAVMDLEDEAIKQRLLACNIFCRVTPQDKLTLIALHQDAGNVVAMTGDGVNDAPALKKADIGVSMGRRGTQVAREASDMVLRDDAFTSITIAVQQGRVIFNNIRSFVIYLLSCNLSEVLLVGVASLLGAPLPLLPLQILFLNLVTDVFPALALGMGEGDRSVMDLPPRPRHEAILTGRHWLSIFVYGLIMSLSVLTVFFTALYLFEWPESEAVTMTFLTIALAQLWHVFNMRGQSSGFFRNDVVKNPYVWAALALCLVLITAYLWLPILARVLSLLALNVEQWLWVVGMSLVTYVLGQVYLGFSKLFGGMRGQFKARAE